MPSLRLINMTQCCRLAIIILVVGLSAGCTGPYIHSTSAYRDHDLYASVLQQQGMAILTPSTITGQEEDKQALAFIFTQVLADLRPDIRQVSLPQTLSMVNKAGLTSDYLHMYHHYRHTGIFKHNVLRQIGELTDSRYVAQLKLAEFEQGSRGRFGMLGLRLVDTKHANIRLFMQIWDTEEGRIVWEASHEMEYAYNTVSESSVSFRTIVEHSAQEIISKLPQQRFSEAKPNLNTKHAVIDAGTEGMDQK